MAENITVFAKTNYRNELKKFGIKTDDRRRHMYLIGKTGMGKSTVLENMIVDDIRAGHGVAVVDPHGDLAEKVIEYIPAHRMKDVIYFNPADIHYPIAFNVVEQVEPHLQHLVASGLIGVFQKLWADSWGPRLEYILRNAILAILDFPGSTLLGVVRMLSDKQYRKRVVSNIKDPVVKAFWEKEFSGYADKFASEAVSPIQNKVGQFLSSSLMRNIIGQSKSAIDIRDIMDNGKILIMNLAKGRIGEDNSALLGAMMITKIQLAAMSRVDLAEAKRRDFYLYIDEFQNFSTDSFANILSEARKYRLNLVLAHQYIAQLSEKVAPAVFGNVGTIITFRVGAADAEELVKEFTPTFTEEDLVNLPKYEMYLKLMIDGMASSPFSAIGLAPLREDEKTDNTEKVIDFSREKYASQKELVEEKIMNWHQDFSDAMDKNPKPDKNRSYAPASNQPSNTSRADIVAEEGFQTSCSSCGVATRTPFKPDGVRPVYCKDCLSKKKEEKRLEAENRKQAKEVEKKQYLDVKEGIKEEVPTISLADLTKSAPVDFRGRRIDSDKFVKREKKIEEKKKPEPVIKEKDKNDEKAEEVISQIFNVKDEETPKQNVKEETKKIEIKKEKEENRQREHKQIKKEPEAKNYNTEEKELSEGEDIIL